MFVLNFHLNVRRQNLAIATKVSLHLLLTLQNNEPVPQEHVNLSCFLCVQVVLDLVTFFE